MRKRRNPFDVPLKRRRRFSPAALIGVAVSLVVVMAVVAVVFLGPYIRTHAAGAQNNQAPNMDCTLIVPSHPLTAKGLATPYQLVATDPNNGPCNEAEATQEAFVQGSIFDFNTGKIYVYNPLVIDKGTKPAVAPVVPAVPNGAVVALWFGFNGANLTLQATNNSLQEGQCTNGTNNSIFGQFAYCNAPLYFGEVNQSISLDRLNVPALGTALDGKPCPSVRDFAVVDQDQSDNVTSAYLLTAKGQTAQATDANKAALPQATEINNGSDNGLLDAFIDPALGCKPWTAPDLANPGAMATALPLNELQAMVDQRNPMALVPLNDPMVLNGANFSRTKLNAYRAGVDQPIARNDGQADPKAYCQNLVTVGSPRIALDATMTVKMTTPDPAVGNTLFTFLTQRFAASYTNLNCDKLLGKASPLITTQDGNGVAISAMLNGQLINTGVALGVTPVAGGPSINPNCTLNGQAVQSCTGSATVNGQTCTFTFTNNTVAVNCRKQ